MEYATYFYDANGKQIASQEILFPIFKGMDVEIHAYEGKTFVVESVCLRIDHPDSKPGVHVYLK